MANYTTATKIKEQNTNRMNSENSTNPKNEKIDYKYICLPKNACLLLNGNERSLFAIMIDYQQMIDQHNNKKGNFSMAISYICRNLDISDKTAQSSINKLIELNLLIKHSGYKTRTKNAYSINFEQIRKYDKLTSDQLFEMRGASKNTKPNKIVESNEAIESINLIQPIEVTQPQIIDQLIEEVAEQRANEPLSAEKVIEEFEHFLISEEKRTPFPEIVLRILPFKYNAEEKQILREHINNDNERMFGMKNVLLKAMA
jgi:hypothetical protein